MPVVEWPINKLPVKFVPASLPGILYVSAKVITPAFESVASPEGVTCVETPELLPKRILPLANSKPKSVLNVEGEFKSNEPNVKSSNSSAAVGATANVICELLVFVKSVSSTS